MGTQSADLPEGMQKLLSMNLHEAEEAINRMSPEERQNLFGDTHNSVTVAMDVVRFSSSDHHEKLKKGPVLTTTSDIDMKKVEEVLSIRGTSEHFGKIVSLLSS